MIENLDINGNNPRRNGYKKLKIASFIVLVAFALFTISRNSKIVKFYSEFVECLRSVEVPLKEDNVDI